MRRSGLRFRPPAVEFAPEVRWALRRAFGPPERAFAEPLDGGATVEVAAKLDLGPRIATRTPLAALQGELGEPDARSLLIVQAMAAILSEQHLKCARVVAEAAAELSLPVAFLKGVALRLTGVTAEGSRWLSDVDVLVRADGARRLAAALVARGFRDEGMPSQEQHLPMLVRGSAESVELHTLALGVRPSGRRNSATLEDLRERALLAPLSEMPGECFVPTREVLVAHTLAHGLAQHGLAPASYPMTRMLADLTDLGLAGPDGERLLDVACPWIARDVSREEAEAARGLCAALAEGDGAVFTPGCDAPETVLLRHVVAGVADEGYRAALRLLGMWDFPSERSRPVAWAVMAFRTVFPNRAQIAAIYGQPRTALGYLGRRLARPFDLAWRLARYTASAVALRGRRSSG